MSSIFRNFCSCYLEENELLKKEFQNESILDFSKATSACQTGKNQKKLEFVLFNKYATVYNRNINKNSRNKFSCSFCHKTCPYDTPCKCVFNKGIIQN